ncbi:FAD-dependent monooxygenase [Streptomyces sp. NBC_01358]|uniref:FAD-dependent monooxygenase n=1 Tax=Streptomyces sp. NBC_01358 TaxID=2903837 RepID=UPI002E321C2A|nr:FAD-dependent monooxygenase [Streptomyces sp. NBC_01358]
MSRNSVLIVGGGIGGLSASIALRKAGYDVHVVEIQQDLHSSVYGVGIIQPVNALRALDAIGCAEACMAVGYATTAWGHMLDVDGNLVREMPGARIPGCDLPPMNGLTRPQLHRILTDKALEAGVVIAYDKTFTTLTDGPDGVEVTYTDGSESVVDLVVGADGVYSKVRPYVLAEDIEPVYLGQSAFRLNIPRDPEIDRIILQHGPEGLAGFVPIGPDLAYLFYNTTWVEGRWLDQDKMADELRKRLAPFGGLAGRVRDAYVNDSSKIVFRPEEWLIAPAPWHKGRIVLMGDAVHAVTPHLGQGAAQAIEDGVVLARCLAAHSSHEEAFAQYTEARYERCRLVVESSVQIGEYEMDPSRHPDFDHAGLTQHVLETMVQPM